MLPCPNREQLERLLADGLSNSEEHAVSVHVQQCGRCQQELEQLTESLDGEKRQLSDAAPSGTAGLAPKDVFIDQLKQTLRPLAGSARGELGGPNFATGSGSPSEAGPLPVIPGCEVLDLLGRGGMGVGKSRSK
jgi:hypothetical protein